MKLSSLLRPAESVLARDMFFKNILLNTTHKNLAFAPPREAKLDIVSPYLDTSVQPVYASIMEMLRLDPSMEGLLQARANRVQEFLGPATSLSFAELLCIICGLANMDIDTRSLPAGSAYGTSVAQEVVRSLGRRFFVLHCTLDTVFADLLYLSQSTKELENSLELFADSDALAVQFMKLNSLDKCVMPYRGAHSRGFVLNPEAVRQAILDKSTAASFYTMIGLLVVKFGSEEVLRNFWQLKILNSSSGILRIISKT